MIKCNTPVKEGNNQLTHIIKVKKFILGIIIILGLTAILPPVVSVASRKPVNNDDNRRKASYTFLEALRQRENDSIDAFYDLLCHAHALDPENSTVAYYLGFCYVTMGNASRETIEDGYQLMKQHFDAVPTDYDEAVIYASVAGRLGHNDEAMAALDTLTKLFPAKSDVRAMLADAYARKGQFREAIATYDTFEAAEGKSLPLSLRKINFYMALNDSVGAINETRSLYDTAPNNATYNLLLGNVFMQVGNRDSAMHYIDRAQLLDPDNGMTYLSKAQIYYNEGDSANYDKQIYNALISKGLDVQSKVDVLTDYIKQLLAERDSSQRIVNLFNVLISQHPHEKDIHQLYSDYFTVQKDFKRAAEQMEYVTDIDPSNAENWMRLMMLELVDKNYPKAIETAQKAIEYNPDSISLYQYIAPAYYEMKEYDKALDIYNKAIMLADTTDYMLQSSIMCGMADVYSALNDTAKAIEYYEDAISLNPGNDLAMNNYAYFLAVRGIDLDRAERLIAEALKTNPENPTMLDTYAWVYFRKKEYTLALAYIKKAIECSKEDYPEIIEHYGDILFMNGEFDQALENWEKALKLNPDSEILSRKVKYKTYFNE